MSYLLNTNMEDDDDYYCADTVNHKHLLRRHIDATDNIYINGPCGYHHGQCIYCLMVGKIAFSINYESDFWEIEYDSAAIITKTGFMDEIDDVYFEPTKTLRRFPKASEIIKIYNYGREMGRYAKEKLQTNEYVLK